MSTLTLPSYETILVEQRGGVGLVTLEPAEGAERARMCRLPGPHRRVGRGCDPARKSAA